MADNTAVYMGTGRRKEAVARVRLVPGTGKVTVNGFDLRNMRRRKLPAMRRTIGVIFQDFRLIEDKTVYENVAFAMHVVGASNREIRRRVPYVLDLVGLDTKSRRHPGELSGGEQQRVAIARALVRGPQLILADEPTGALDIGTGQAVMALLQEVVAESGAALVTITHDPNVAALADRHFLLDAGRLSAGEEAA